MYTVQVVDVYVPGIYSCTLYTVQVVDVYVPRIYLCTLYRLLMFMYLGKIIEQDEDDLHQLQNLLSSWGNNQKENRGKKTFFKDDIVPFLDEKHRNAIKGIRGV